MVHTKGTRYTVLVLSLCLLITACATPVTYRQEPVTDEAQKTAAQAIRVADITSAAVVRFLKQGHQAGIIPDDVLNQYADDIGPALQSALDTSRNGLERAIVVGDPEATSALLAQVETLLEVLNQATALAAKYGW